MKTVVLGITGCIAAYKACELVRILQKNEVRVKVVMTKHACEFVGPATFRALTKESVAIDLFDKPQDPIHHISLAKEADLFCVAPATANCIAKLSGGIADDLLTTTALAVTCPRIVAPAMNSAMYDNEETQANLSNLKARGWEIIEPESGYLACGDDGRGRLADVSIIANAILLALKQKQDFVGKRFLITAGPTQEAIDPVRCITNHSSGIMGYEIAYEAVARGACVTLVSGPVSLQKPKNVNFVPVTSAQEMFDASKKAFEDADYAIFVAAVSDWRPKDVSQTKIKHDGNEMVITCVPNPDIAKILSQNKGDKHVIIFAAETKNPVQSAKEKLKKKNADLVVANDVSGDLGFGTRENKVWLIGHEFEKELPVMSKREIARSILNTISEM